jgi:hypothetical protein
MTISLAEQTVNCYIAISPDGFGRPRDAGTDPLEPFQAPARCRAGWSQQIVITGAERRHRNATGSS